MAEDGVVRAASDDPGFGRGAQIRMRFPQGVGHRQLRQFVRRFHRFNGVHQQTIAIAEIDQAGDDRRAGLGVKDDARRIGFPADAQRRFSSRLRPQSRSPAASDAARRDPEAVSSRVNLQRWW